MDLASKVQPLLNKISKVGGETCFCFSAWDSTFSVCACSGKTYNPEAASAGILPWPALNCLLFCHFLMNAKIFLVLAKFVEYCSFLWFLNCGEDFCWCSKAEFRIPESWSHERSCCVWKSGIFYPRYCCSLFYNITRDVRYAEFYAYRVSMCCSILRMSSLFSYSFILEGHSLFILNGAYSFLSCQFLFINN